MESNFASSAVAGTPPQRPTSYSVLQAILHLQKFNACSVNNLKRYLASQLGIDCHMLDSTIKPIMKKAMELNILKNLGDTGKVSECKKSRKSAGGGKKRRKSAGKKKGKKSTKGKKGRKTAGGTKKRRRKSKKTAAAAAA